MDCSIYDAGKNDVDGRPILFLASPHKSLFHTHRGYVEFVYVIRGSFRHVFDDSTRLCPAHSLIFIREKDRHRTDGASYRIANMRYRTGDVLRAGSFIAPEKYKALMTASEPPTRELRPDEAAYLEASLSLAAGNDERAGAAIKTLLIDCLSLLALPSVEQPEQPDWIAAATSYVRDEILAGRVPKAAAMARVCGKTQEHFARTFKSCFHMTPTAYINIRRIEQAAHLLASTTDTITEICSGAGFENVHHFYTLFSNRYHVTPAVYRKRRSNAFAL
ncbi:MAG: helix-turn-helix domain-containing protein [Spirochaetes bacterium]|nr:helix-turn-helix domain-containing protein [Spirochaetota bacterium]